MYEVEVKVPADHEEVAAALSDAGAEREALVAQSDTYYDAPHREFAETDEALRIRTVASVPGHLADETAAEIAAAVFERDAAVPETRVTYKGPLVEAASKSREEFETGVADGETMAAIFDRLGFDPAATVRKVRARYRLDGWTVVLDDVLDVGTYVEVETDVETEDDVAAAREAAYGLLRDLGLDPETQIRTSYLGLTLGDSHQ